MDIVKLFIVMIRYLLMGVKTSPISSRTDFIGVSEIVSSSFLPLFVAEP